MQVLIGQFIAYAQPATWLLNSDQT